jgi:hypothetical protein
MTLSHLKVQVTAAEPEVPSARLTSCTNHEHALTRRQQAFEFDQHLTSICDLVIAIFFFLFFLKPCCRSASQVVCCLHLSPTILDESDIEMLIMDVGMSKTSLKQYDLS